MKFQALIFYNSESNKELKGDPLSDTNGWGQKFKDEDLMVLIKQDVDRTIPEVAFFQSDRIRTMMCNILFIHAKIDPALCYKGKGLQLYPSVCPPTDCPLRKILVKLQLFLTLFYSKMLKSHIFSYIFVLISFFMSKYIR